MLVKHFSFPKFSEFKLEFSLWMARSVLVTSIFEKTGIDCQRADIWLAESMWSRQLSISDDNEAFLERHVATVGKSQSGRV
jgi:hypothetical protein